MPWCHLLSARLCPRGGPGCRSDSRVPQCLETTPLAIVPFLKIIFYFNPPFSPLSLFSCPLGIQQLNPSVVCLANSPWELWIVHEYAQGDRFPGGCLYNELIELRLQQGCSPGEKLGARTEELCVPGFTGAWPASLRRNRVSDVSRSRQAESSSAACPKDIKSIV